MRMASAVALLCINCLRTDKDEDINIRIYPRYVHDYDVGYTFASDTFEVTNQVKVNYHIITNEDEYVKTLRVEWDSDENWITVLYTSNKIDEEQVFGMCPMNKFERLLWNFSNNKCRFSCSIDHIVDGQKSCEDIQNNRFEMFKTFVKNTKFTNIEVVDTRGVRCHGGEIRKLVTVMNVCHHHMNMMLHPQYLCYTLADPEVETNMEFKYFDNDIAYFKIIDEKNPSNKPIEFAYTKKELKDLFGIDVCRSLV
jgi:hypothetical protein